MKLYYHKTGGGAEYLMDTFIEWEKDGKKGKEGVMNDETKYVVRIDGDITKDAELSVREPKTKHMPAYCSVKSCHNEAERWRDLGGEETFYACDSHGELLGEEDDNLGEYSCGEYCDVCN